MIKNAYIHIPFCQSKCNYCSFVSYTGISNEDKQAYVNTLLAEIEHFYKKEVLETLYFGGGTPSLMTVEQLAQIKNAFVLDFRRQKENSDSYKASNELFATLNNNDYKYGRQFIAGTWYNVRTPIDAEGKAIGLPEAIDNMGNPIVNMEAKNIHSITYSKPALV